MRAELRWPLCRQTVTLYHADPAARQVTRVVVRGAFLDHRRREVMDTASQSGTAFLLIIPERSARWGVDYTLAPHDRVYDGEGPEVSYDGWPAFVRRRCRGWRRCSMWTPRPGTGRPAIWRRAAGGPTRAAAPTA